MSGNGLVAYAGILTESRDRFYLADEYDLGSGLPLPVSYAERRTMTST